MQTQRIHFNLYYQQCAHVPDMNGWKYWSIYWLIDWSALLYEPASIYFSSLRVTEKEKKRKGKKKAYNYVSIRWIDMTKHIDPWPWVLNEDVCGGSGGGSRIGWSRVICVSIRNYLIDLLSLFESIERGNQSIDCIIAQKVISGFWRGCMNYLEGEAENREIAKLYPMKSAIILFVCSWGDELQWDKRLHSEEECACVCVCCINAYVHKHKA